MLSDLRESGSIEQDADVVIFLYRAVQPKNEEGEEERQDNFSVFEVKVSIAKHRNGQIGEVSLMFQPGLNSFYDKEKDDER